MHWRCVGLSLVLCGHVACTRLPPSGPHVLVTPAPGTPYGAFLDDEQSCRVRAGWLSTPLVSPHSARLARLVPLVVGAGVGLALGAATGNIGPGLALGAALGLWVGDWLGGSRDARSRIAVQRAYDRAYAQCMVAAGHHLPPVWWLPDDERSR